MTKVSAEEKSEALKEWRAKHFDQLEITLKVLMDIRDDLGASRRDRIDASKAIGRLLDAITPEKVSKVPTKSETRAKHEITAEEWSEIERRLQS